MTGTKEISTRDTAAEETRPRGRPRSEKARTAILESAIELLLEQGLHAMSMDDVAQRAGVSKATIYRWWPSKELLALDALGTAWATPTPDSQRDTGSLRGDLLAGFRAWMRQLKMRPYGRVIAGLVAQAQTDPEFAQLYREHFVYPAAPPPATSWSGASTAVRSPPTPTSMSLSICSTDPSTTGSSMATQR